jgi:hypothetical protein
MLNAVKHLLPYPLAYIQPPGEAKRFFAVLTPQEGVADAKVVRLT